MVTPCARLLLAITLWGCGQGPKTRARASGEHPENQPLLAKLEGYIGCIGEHATRVFQIADLYRERVGGQPPTPDTLVPLQPSPAPEDCLLAMVEARLVPPQLPELDGAGVAFGDALAAVFLLTSAAHGYADRASATYDPAKAIALHPELIAAFDEFDRAETALFDQLYRLNRPIHIDQLAQRQQKEGRKLAIISDAVMFEAEDLVRFAATPWHRLDTIDLPALTTQLAAVENVIHELTTYAEAHPSEAEAFGGVRPLVEVASAYVITARQLAHRTRDHVGYTDAEKLMIGANNEAAVPGTPGAMIKAYNQLVGM